MFKRALVGTVLAMVSASVMMLVVAPSCAANRFSHSPTNSGLTQSQNNRARKFDEYGEGGECDEGARLDNFAIHLVKEPATKGYIISYDGRDTLPARLGVRHLRALRYLVEFRGIDPKRLVAIDGGYREETSTELWIAPKRAPAPEPSDTIIVTKETGKSFKYNETYPESAVVPYQEFDDAPEGDAASAGDESTELKQDTAPTQDIAVEPPPALTQETAADDKAEPENYDYLWASEGYARALEAEKADAYVIYYAQREGGYLFALQQIIAGGQNLLVMKHGIKEERIRPIFGGYRDYTIIELWVVPPGASPPVPTPDYEKETASEEANSSSQ
jgi:hypothetical protein